MLFRLANKTANKYPINCVACGLSVSALILCRFMMPWDDNKRELVRWSVILSPSNSLVVVPRIHFSLHSSLATMCHNTHNTHNTTAIGSEYFVLCPVQMPSASVTKGANRAEIKCTVSARVAELNHRNRFGDDKIRY